MHGQITTVTLDWTWRTFIVDCGCFWMKHDFYLNTYKVGSYDETGRFTTLDFVSREKFIEQLKVALKNVKRVLDAESNVSLDKRRKQTTLDFMLQRYWINQPSTLQPHHELHGAKVLAEIKREDRYTTVYFTDGPVIDQEMAVLALSPGWPQNNSLT